MRILRRALEIRDPVANIQIPHMGIEVVDRRSIETRVLAPRVRHRVCWIGA